MFKKIVLLIFLCLIVLSPAYSEDETRYASDPEGWWNSLWADVTFDYDVYARSTMQRGSISFGGGLSLGVTTDRFKFTVYGQTDYFLQPLGGQGGVALFEMDAEAGMTMGMKILSFWAFDTYIACDVGYYMQFLKTPYQSDIATLGFNGLMIRPKLLTDLRIAKYYGIMLGVYYQIPVYPGYSDYSGFGIMLSIA